MRTGILTDVHANHEALTACVAQARKVGVDRFVCLGDTVGYGADPNAACDLVREICQFAVLGNHDAAVSGRMDYSFYYEAARHALDWTREVLSEDNLRWLQSLPYAVPENQVMFGHGSPLDPEAFEYIFALEQAEDLAIRAQNLAGLTFIGHSHLQRAYLLSPAVRDVWQERVHIDARNKYLCSIGSCGQPRDYDARSCFGVWDDETRIVEFHRVPYDNHSTSRKILQAGLSPHFARRLLHGV